jgi:hypothetical protein
MEINLLESIAIYLHFQRHEDEKDPRILKLLNKIEKDLYDHLSIQEIENIEVYYKETI